MAPAFAVAGGGGISIAGRVNRDGGSDVRCGHLGHRP